MADPRTLASLREAISGVDRALLELLRQRMELAAAVGHIKADSGMPVVRRDVEDRVLGRARQHAELCGVSEEVMAEIFQAIIRGSVERQHRVGVAKRTSRGSRVLILGGAGGMGSWMRVFLSRVGHHVEALDPAWVSLGPEPGRHTTLDEVADLDSFEFLVVSVPLTLTPAVLADLVARRPAGTVVEIASIKDHLSPSLARAEKLGVWVSSLHPMFGPGKSLYEPLTFVLACQRPEDAERARLEPLLRHPYTDLVTLPLSHHDRLMGWLLGLAHFTGMLFGSALTRSELTPSELHACASTTFLRQASTALSVLSEDADLYLDIQRLNPHRNEVYGALQESLNGLVTMVSDNDREKFRECLAAARRAVVDES